MIKINVPLIARITILILLLGLMLLFSSCGSLFKSRKVDKTKETIHFMDRSVITQKAPSDIIVLPAPRSPNDRPKDTVIVTKGKNGATATTSYDKDGFLSGQVVNCPDSEMVKQMNVKGEYEIRSKKVDHEFNLEAIDRIGKWLSITFIPIGLFFSIAWFARGRK